MDKDLYEKGLAVRREVLGKEYVDKAIAGETRSPARVVADARLDEIRRNIRQEAGYVVKALEFEVDSLRQRESQLEEMIRELEVTRIKQAAEELRIDRLERASGPSAFCGFRCPNCHRRRV